MASSLMFAMLLAVTGLNVRPDIRVFPMNVGLSPTHAVRIMVVSYRQPMTADDATQALKANNWLPANEDELLAFTNVPARMTQLLVAGVVRADRKLPIVESGSSKIQGRLAATCWPSGTLFLMVRREARQEVK
jgi:hypothetical protein